MHTECTLSFVLGLFCGACSVVGLLCSAVCLVYFIRKYDVDNHLLNFLFPQLQHPASKRLEDQTKKLEKEELITPKLVLSKPETGQSKRRDHKEKKRTRSCNFTPRKEGWLERKLSPGQGAGSGWSKRFYVLHPKWLLLFKDEKKQEPVAFIHLKECKVTQQKNAVDIFEISHLKNNSIYHNQCPDFPTQPLVDNRTEIYVDTWKCIQKASNAHEADEWIIALERCIDSSSHQGVVYDSENSDDGELSGNSYRTLCPPSPALTPRLLKHNVAAEDAVTALKEELGPSFKHEKYDNDCLLRFLRSRQFNIKETAAMFTTYLEWERDFKPKSIDPNSIADLIDTRMAYLVSRDKEGRPTILVCPGKLHPKAATYEKFLCFVVYIIEGAISMMLPPVDKFTVIVDCTDLGMSNLDYDLIKKIIFALGNYYPERMGETFVLNYSLVVNAIWKIVKPWLDPTTAKKVLFVSSHKKLLENFNQSDLPTFLGGTSQYIPEGLSIGTENLTRHFLSSPSLASSV